MGRTTEHTDRLVWRRRPTSLPQVELAAFEASTHRWSGFQTTWDLCAVIEGAAEWRYRGRTMLSTPGTIRLKEPGESFRTLSVKSPSSMRLLRLDPALVAALLDPLPASARHLRVLQLERRPACFEGLVALLDRLAEPRSRLAHESLLHHGLSTLLLDHLEPHPAAPLDPGPRAVRRVREHIDAHYDRELSLQALASLAGVHPVYLSRLFRRHVGLSPHAYQTERRVIAAKDHLRRGMHGAQVASAVGFFDQSHLIRHFKRIVGVTPHAYCRLSGRRRAGDRAASGHSTRTPRAPRKHATLAMNDG